MRTRPNLRLVIFFTVLTSALTLVVISFGTVGDHGGTISVSSEEGRDARFQIELPLVHQAEHQYV